MNDQTRARLQIMGEFVELCAIVSPGFCPADPDALGLFVQRVVSEAIAPLEAGQEIDQNWQEAIRNLLVKIGETLLKPPKEDPAEVCDPWIRPCPNCRAMATRRPGVNVCSCGRRWRES